MDFHIFQRGRNHLSTQKKLSQHGTLLWMDPPRPSGSRLSASGCQVAGAQNPQGAGECAAQVPDAASRGGGCFASNNWGEANGIFDGKMIVIMTYHDYDDGFLWKVLWEDEEEEGEEEEEE